MSVPRYPKIRVAVESENPAVLVSALRYALRRAGVDRREIADFSEQALESRDPYRVCAEWAWVDSPAQRS